MLTSDECARRYRTLESRRRMMASNMAPWDAVGPVEAEMRELLSAFDTKQAPPAHLRNAYNQMAPYVGAAPRLL